MAAYKVLFPIFVANAKGEREEFELAVSVDAKSASEAGTKVVAKLQQLADEPPDPEPKKEAANRFDREVL